MKSNTSTQGLLIRFIVALSILIATIILTTSCTVEIDPYTNKPLYRIDQSTLIDFANRSLAPKAIVIEEAK